MTTCLIILADAAETIIGLLVGAVFVAAWVMSALASGKKKRRTSEGAASWQDILKELSGAASGQQTMTPQPPPVPVQPVRQPQQQRQQQREPQQQRGRRQKGRKQRGAETPPVVVAQPLVEMEGVVHSTLLPPAVVSPMSEARRPAITSLLNRQNLRNLIILSEILQPPVSLRHEQGRK